MLSHTHSQLWCSSGTKVKRSGLHLAKREIVLKQGGEVLKLVLRQGGQVFKLVLRREVV